MTSQEPVPENAVGFSFYTYPEPPLQQVPDSSVNSGTSTYLLLPFQQVPESSVNSGLCPETLPPLQKVPDSSVNSDIFTGLQQVPDSSVKSDIYTNGEATSLSEQKTTEATINETNSAVYTNQACRYVNNAEFLHLHPAPKCETVVEVENARFHPVVANSEYIAANRQIVSVTAQSNPSALRGRTHGDGKTQEEDTSRRMVHVPNKNYQGSSVANSAVVLQMTRPSPTRTVSSANSSKYHGNKVDTYDAFGKYIASMLRGIPFKTSYKLQGEIVNWILKEQMRNTSS